MYEGSTQQKNWEKAVMQTQMAGVVTLINVDSCCRSCASAEMADQGVKEDTALVWTFAGQGSRLEWHDGVPMQMEEHELEPEPSYSTEVDDDGNEIEVEEYDDPDIEYRPVRADSVYLYHQAGGAEVAVEKFKEAGFDVEWDGSESTAVLVNFK
jgi:hypothetical protein